MADTAKVTKVTQTSVTDTSGRLAIVYNVQFTVGAHGPFTIQVPAAQFTAAAVQAQLAEFAATLSAIAPAS